MESSTAERLDPEYQTQTQPPPVVDGEGRAPPPQSGVGVEADDEDDDEEAREKLRQTHLLVDEIKFALNSRTEFEDVSTRLTALTIVLAEAIIKFAEDNEEHKLMVNEAIEIRDRIPKVLDQELAGVVVARIKKDPHSVAFAQAPNVDMLRGLSNILRGLGALQRGGKKD
jgi:hypothetical protein